MIAVLSFVLAVLITSQAYVVPNSLGGYGLGTSGLNGYNPNAFSEFADGIAGGVASSVGALGRPLGGYGGFGGPGVFGNPLNNGLLGAQGLHSFGGGFPMNG